MSTPDRPTPPHRATLGWAFALALVLAGAGLLAKPAAADGKGHRHHHDYAYYYGGGDDDDDDDDDDDGGYYYPGPRVIYTAPPVQYAPAPVYVQPPPVYAAPEFSIVIPFDFD